MTRVRRRLMRLRSRFGFIVKRRLCTVAMIAGRSSKVRRIARALLSSRQFVRALLIVAPTLGPAIAPRAIAGAVRLGAESGFGKVIASDAAALFARRQNFVALLVAVDALVASERWRNAFDLATGPLAGTLPRRQQRAIELRLPRILLELGEYEPAVSLLEQLAVVLPLSLRRRGDFVFGAFCAGMLLQPALAQKLAHRQYGPERFASLQISDNRKAVGHLVMGRALAAIGSGTRRSRQNEITNETRTGVFLFGATHAVGHAILDAYIFLALHGSRFDTIYFCGPPRSSYTPATRVALRLIESYVNYIETEDEVICGLSWISLGEHEFGNVTLVLENYWSLIRDAAFQSRMANSDFTHNAWHVTPDGYLDLYGEAVARAIGIDPDRPLVVVHARDSGYHDIGKQAFRDSSIVNYISAVEALLASGHQVVRIGDRKMPRLGIEHGAYFEVPFHPRYDPILDPYLISRARFMIGCQSGPCAYARAFGTPILTINAVLHYTLLPGTKEMACFKTYRRLDGTELSLEEALERGAAFFDHGFHFAKAGIEVVDATPEEIRLATEDMLSWLERPDQPMSAEQVAFRSAVTAVSDRLARDGNPTLPIADFLGIALDGYRISPSVAAARAEKRRVGRGAMP